MNNLSKVVMQLLPRIGFEPRTRPVDHKSNVLPVVPLHHLIEI